MVRMLLLRGTGKRMVSVLLWSTDKRMVSVLLQEGTVKHMARG